MFWRMKKLKIEVMDSPPLNEMNSQSKAKGRSKNFSEAEDILLISAYLNTRIDSITGRDQKDDKYWERIENYFHENKTFVTDRNWSSLKHRWGIINKEVSIFCGFHDNNESGKTSNDKVMTTVHALESRRTIFPLPMHTINTIKHSRKSTLFRSIKQPSCIFFVWTSQVLCSKNLTDRPHKFP